MRLFSAGTADAQARLSALQRSQAMIEFGLDGKIRTANEVFLKALGYSLDDIVGNHHSMFVEAKERDGLDYQNFWKSLANGEFKAGQFKRIGKDGREIWIEASYNPILDGKGRPQGVIKIASDVTAQKLDYAGLLGQCNAIRKSQAVIEFTLDGIILDANDNFLSTLGYTLPEIAGKHHRMFVDPGYARSPDYAKFWERLKQGEFEAAQYRRLGKGGREVWIEASYNPILDLNGRPIKVVKYATDITRQVNLLSNLNRLIEQNFGDIETALEVSGHESQVAARAADETSASVQAMASSTEELAASVQEISHSMTQSRTATDRAFQQTENASDATQRLGQAAAAMGGIVGLIQTIAGQINLLALNATIESARAGEAGRGFAVVASEVKNLANQASKATEQISREIEGVQALSSEVVVSLDAIRGAVASMRDYVLTTATAVEEQSVVTNEISSSMNGTARAVQAISANIGEICGAVGRVERAVVDTKEAASVLAR